MGINIPTNTNTNLNSTSKTKLLKLKQTVHYTGDYVNFRMAIPVNKKLYDYFLDLNAAKSKKITKELVLKANNFLSHFLAVRNTRLAKTNISEKSAEHYSLYKSIYATATTLDKKFFPIADLKISAKVNLSSGNKKYFIRIETVHPKLPHFLALDIQLQELIMGDTLTIL